MLTHHYQISTNELDDIDSLSLDCQRFDGNKIPIYKHLLIQQRMLPCCILYYDEKKLIGFLSIFFFYNDACEVSIMVAPASRRKGVATKMITEILPLIRSQKIQKLIFSTPFSKNKAWLANLGFSYQNSEFRMQRDSGERLVTNKSVVVRMATDNDIPALCAIDSACFPAAPPPEVERFYLLFKDTNYQLFIAQKGGQPIGKAHVHYQHDGTCLTDIAILPALQGQGFGSALLAHCINSCLSMNRSIISLDVETTNHQALNLYTRLGFVINNAYDFWNISMQSLTKL